MARWQRKFFTYLGKGEVRNKTAKSNGLAIWLIGDCILDHLWQYRRHDDTAFDLTHQR